MPPLLGRFVFVGLRCCLWVSMATLEWLAALREGRAPLLAVVDLVRLPCVGLGPSPAVGGIPVQGFPASGWCHGWLLLMVVCRVTVVTNDPVTTC